ncbi:hypothetical protein ONZ45_g3702 [Pleurotus djamor]|nr:hypothetical protein ONZ45_g3702 [Pleurotus djamor]
MTAMRRVSITALAPETSSMIIWHASRKDPAGPRVRLPEGDIARPLDAHRLTNLRLVCKEWNAIIQSSPLLWRAFSPIDPLRTIQKVLEHTGDNIPLMISHKYSPSSSQLTSPDAVKLVFSQLHRTTDLHICLKISKWIAARSVFEFNTNASLLEWLEIHASHFEVPHRYWSVDPSPQGLRHELQLRKLPSLPRLQKLFLSGIKLPEQITLLPHLVSLHLEAQGQAGKSVEDLLEALRYMPSLQSLRLNYCPVALVSLPFLRSVHIIDENVRACANFLKSLQAELTWLHIPYTVETYGSQEEHVPLMVEAGSRLLERSFAETPHELFVIKDLFETDGSNTPLNFQVSFSLRSGEYKRPAIKSSRYKPKREDEADVTLPLKLSIKKYYNDNDQYYPEYDIASFCLPFITSMAPLLGGVTKLLIDHEASHYHWDWDWLVPILKHELSSVQYEEEEDEDEELDDDFDPDADDGLIEQASLTFERLARSLGSEWVVESPGILKRVLEL